VRKFGDVQVNRNIISKYRNRNWVIEYI